MGKQTPARFRQDASYAQIFWAAREWLVPAVAGERLTVERPYRESLLAVGGQLTARLGPQFTLSLGARIQHNQLTGRTSPAFTVRLAMKTPN
jgi:outer membrane receptor protein involved in Fe transport